MDIAALSIIKSQVQLKQDAGIAVMKKAMNTAKDNVAEGKANLQHVGNNVDVYV